MSARDARKSISSVVCGAVCRVGPVGSGLPLPGVEKRPRRGWAHGLGVGWGDPHDSRASVRQRGDVTAGDESGADAAWRRGGAVLETIACHAAQRSARPDRPDPAGDAARAEQAIRRLRPSAMTDVGRCIRRSTRRTRSVGFCRPLSGATRDSPKTPCSGPHRRRRRFRLQRPRRPVPNRCFTGVRIAPAAAVTAKTRRGGAFFRTAKREAGADGPGPPLGAPRHRRSQRRRRASPRAATH